MPTKYKPSIVRFDRKENKRTVQHCYIKALTTDQLTEMLNGTTTRPKDKQKFRNELQRRGF